MNIRDSGGFEYPHVPHGAPYPHKADAQRLLEKLVSERQRLVSDAEVLQEILHRYVAMAVETPSSLRLTLCSE